jgi:dinuclear metal center YbgI/SA1388 family protein
MKPAPPASLSAVVLYLDKELKPAAFHDWEGAANGLQVENHGTVSKVAASVDASLATIREAVQAGADLMIVHHGLFWSPSHPWTGAKYRLLKTILDGGLAVYSSHLPLDAHPKLGNNALLAKALGLGKTRPFYIEKGAPIGLQAACKIDREDLRARLTRALGREPLLLPGGPAQCRQIGVVTGGAGGGLRRAAEEGVDTFITGEGPHHTHALSEELGVNVFYGGHYLTETFGVKALAERISRKFKLPWFFIDHPSGL